MLAPAKAQSSLLRRAPFEINLAHVRFKSAIFERIRAKLMEHHRLRSSPVGRNEHVGPLDCEPVIRPHRAKRSE